MLMVLSMLLSTKLHLFNIDEEVGEEIYDEILTYVNDNGYDFIGEEFE